MKSLVTTVFACALFSSSLLLNVSIGHADIVVIDDQFDVYGPLGPLQMVFGNNPSSSPGHVAEILNMGNSQQPDAQNGTITAGQIWTAFDNAGISTVDTLILSMGINETGSIGSNWVNLEKLQLKILNPLNNATNITNIDMDSAGDHTVRVFNYAQGANTAEAQIAILLGYDFMTTFNGTSAETVRLDVTVTNRSDGFEIFFFDSAANAAIPEPTSFLLPVVFAFALARRRNRKSNQVI